MLFTRPTGFLAQFAAASLLSASLLASAGCQQGFVDPNQRLADQSLNRRVTGMSSTLRIAAESESIRPGRLDFDAHWIAKDIRGSATRLNQNLGLLEDRIQFEVKRFEDNQPLYRETLEQIFWGHPEHVEPNAIILFF